MVHTVVNACQASQVQASPVLILMNVRLVTMSVTRMPTVKILTAVTSALVLAVLWETETAVSM